MNTFDEILGKIKEYDTIILHRHTNPDPDAIGSQEGLAKSLRLAFPEKTILCTGENDVGDLAWINTMDEVKDSDYEGALVITTDTANTPRVSDKRYNMGDFLIKIDHHPDVDQYADMEYVDPTASAASELIADFIDQEKLPLNQEIALALYAGIVGDTGRFLYDATTTHTFEVAARLKATGIDTAQIARSISEVTLGQAKLQNLSIDKLAIDEETGAALAVISQADLKQLGVSQAEASACVSSPGRIRGILAWIVAVEKGDGTYRIHYRSKGPFIHKLAESHDGGGHELASGANAKDAAEVDQIYRELVDACKNYKEEHPND